MTVDREMKQITKQSAVNLGVILAVIAIAIPIIGYQFRQAVNQAVAETRWKTEIEKTQEYHGRRITTLEGFTEQMRDSQRRMERALGTLPPEQQGASYPGYGYTAPDPVPRDAGGGGER